MIIISHLDEMHLGNQIKIVYNGNFSQLIYGTIPELPKVEVQYKTYYCDICQKSLKHTETNINRHLNSASHRKNADLRC